MPSVLRSAAVFAAVLAMTALTMPGCSQQGEGERCDSVKSGNDDCDSGLTCIAAGQLLDGATDRCCPAAGTEDDDRCQRKTTMSGSGGSGGSGGTSASEGGTSASEGGTSASEGGTSASEGGTSGNSSAGAPDTAASGAGGAD